MNYISSLNDNVILKTIGCTALAATCGYGGTFFFTSLNPATSAIYLGVASLTCQVAYHILERVKETSQSPMFRHGIQAVQLLQIPLFFYLFPQTFGILLTGAEKLEISAATAYFTAIPLFFHLGIAAWNDPTVPNITAAIGVLLPLANGLGNYAKAFRQTLP